MATPSKATLLDLVQAVSDFATSDDEIVATVTYLINSGKVLLCGNFAGATIDLPLPAYAARALLSYGVPACQPTSAASHTS